MHPLLLGIVFGVGFAAFDALSMARLHWYSPRQRLEAIGAAVLGRFMIGLLIPTADLDTPRWLTGVIVGLGLSLPSAILTRAYQPIIGIGLVGGLALGIAAQILL